MTRQLKRLDLIVKDPPTAAQFFVNVLGWELRESGERFAEVADEQGFGIMFSPDAMIPVQAVSGTILHVDVEDVSGACEAARRQGATVVLPPTITDWGWEIALVAGPENVLIQFDCIAQTP
jgi:predicted enzyme related to lactoylglutathione lyase